MSVSRGVPLLSGVQTVKSIRDTGYKSTDYAIAELIDNSVDAEAENITVVIVEEAIRGKSRRTLRASEIWVLDDGCGMTEERANLALSFGGAGNYNNRKSIGRFGMGLPQASVSQCRRTEVWSWQESQLEKAHLTWLDLDEIEANQHPELRVPWPVSPGDEGYVNLPEWIIKTYRELHSVQMKRGQPTSSGTIVRWRNLDRLRWVRAASVVEHTEFLLGRIYRRFLVNDRKNINIVIVEKDDNGEVTVSQPRSVRPNDPLYLLTPEDSVLEYWQKEVIDEESGEIKDRWARVRDKAPFFQWKTERRYEVKIPDKEGEKSTVTVRFSEARAEARPGKQAGSYTHLGRQAKNNRGISLMRADRELLLEQTLVTEPVDRWWGVEVEFSPMLDEVFGVTNNKQDAPYFTTALRLVLDNEMDPETARQEALFDEDNPVAELYTIAYEISRSIGVIKREAKSKQTAKKRNTSKQPARVATVATNVNRKFSQQRPTKGEQEYIDRGLTKEEAAAEIERELVSRHGVDEEAAIVVASQYRQGVSVHFLEAGQSQSPAFFWPDEVFNDEQIYINTEHPAYEQLIEPLRLSSEDISGLGENDAKNLLGIASDCLAFLLQAFSRLELEMQSDPRAANYYMEVREEWGRRLREVVTDDSFLAEELFDDDSGG